MELQEWTQVKRPVTPLHFIDTVTHCEPCWDGLYSCSCLQNTTIVVLCKSVNLHTCLCQTAPHRGNFDQVILFIILHKVSLLHTHTWEKAPLDKEGIIFN